MLGSQPPPSTRLWQFKHVSFDAPCYRDLSQSIVARSSGLGQSSWSWSIAGAGRGSILDGYRLWPRPHPQVDALRRRAVEGKERSTSLVQVAGRQSPPRALWRQREPSRQTEAIVDRHFLCSILRGDRLLVRQSGSTRWLFALGDLHGVVGFGWPAVVARIGDTDFYTPEGNPAHELYPIIILSPDHCEAMSFRWESPVASAPVYVHSSSLGHAPSWGLVSCNCSNQGYVCSATGVVTHQTFGIQAYTPGRTLFPFRSSNIAMRLVGVVLGI